MSQPPDNIWIPNVHTYPKGEKDQDRSLWEEGYIRRIQSYIKFLLNILPRAQEDRH